MLNKFVFCFLFLILPQFLLSAKTFEFKCSDDLQLDVCFLKDTIRSGDNNVSTTFYLNKCSGGKKCSLVGDGSSKQCVKVKELLQDGKKCKVNSECQSQNCANEKCVYKVNGETCEKDKNCGESSYCKFNAEKQAYECAPLLGKDEICNDSKECEFGLLCEEKCKEMFSLENGANSYNDLLCKSGISYNGKCEFTVTENSTCAENEFGLQQCLINVNGGKKSINCRNDDTELNESNYFCPLQANSKLLQEYIKVYKEEKDKLTNNDIKKIHISTMNKETLNGNKKVREAWVNYKNYYIIGNKGDSDCIRDYYIDSAGCVWIQLSLFSCLSFLLLLFK